MWSMVAHRLTQITPPAATPDQLWQRVEAASSAVPQEHIQCLFESSMLRRVATSFFYADKPQTLDYLEDNIRRVIADIRPQMLEKVIENWTSRLDYIRASRGSPMSEIIFKM
ncbi:hypothetical protein TNCV_965261 [Trichonephila clavipes]|nr:hypothetical protein TNCV_965261 [Trichonephila clavipes]